MVYFPKGCLGTSLRRQMKDAVKISTLLHLSAGRSQQQRPFVCVSPLSLSPPSVSFLPLALSHSLLCLTLSVISLCLSHFLPSMCFSPPHSPCPRSLSPLLFLPTFALPHPLSSLSLPALWLTYSLSPLDHWINQHYYHCTKHWCDHVWSMQSSFGLQSIQRMFCSWRRRSATKLMRGMNLTHEERQEELNMFSLERRLQSVDSFNTY